MKKLLPLAVLLSVGAAMPALAMDKGHHEKSGHFFSEMDKNGDGVVNQSEHHAFTHKMFREADTNKDQLISRRELEKQMHKRHASFHGGYDDMAPSAGYDNKPRFGSRSDRVYDSHKDVQEYEGYDHDHGHYHSDKPYDKNYKRY